MDLDLKLDFIPLILPQLVLVSCVWAALSARHIASFLDTNQGLNGSSPRLQEQCVYGYG